MSNAKNNLFMINGSFSWIINKEGFKQKRKEFQYFCV